MRHHYSAFLLLIGAFVGTTSLADASFPGFTNGQVYVISSASSSKVLTSGTSNNFTRAATVILTTWNDDSNQKWLALEAPAVIQVSPTAREIQPPRFYLIPQRQEWDWNTVTKNATLNITNTKDLPPFTEVLSLDSITGNLTTEVFNAGSSSQAWIPEDAGESQIFIRNLGNNQCVKNFDVPNPLSTFDCNAKDTSEKWIAEL